MINKRGGIVAIEPETGEILSLVSAPNYNPNLLTGGTGLNILESYLMIPLQSLFDKSHKRNILLDLL